MGRGHLLGPQQVCVIESPECHSQWLGGFSPSPGCVVVACCMPAGLSRGEGRWAVSVGAPHGVTSGKTETGCGLCGSALQKGLLPECSAGNTLPSVSSLLFASCTGACVQTGQQMVNPVCLPLPASGGDPVGRRKRGPTPLPQGGCPRAQCQPEVERPASTALVCVLQRSVKAPTGSRMPLRANSSLL